MQGPQALNPLFLRDAELEKNLAQLATLQRELDAAIEVIVGRAGIDLGDHRLLALVGRRPQTTAAELVQALGWTKQRVSRRVAALVRGGLLEPAASSSDRRKQPLVLTPAGVAHVAETEAQQKRLLRRIYRRAGPADVGGFSAVLAIAAQPAGRPWRHTETHE